jgi:hypothetical protein
MEKFDEIRLTGNNYSELLTCVDNVAPKLPVELRRVFQKAINKTLQTYGTDHSHAHLVNKSVAEILAIAETLIVPKPIASGEIEGIKYTLHDKPDAP